MQWHSITAERDVKWVEELMSRLVPGADPKNVQRNDLARVDLSSIVDPNPRTRTFGG